VSRNCNNHSYIFIYYYLYFTGNHVKESRIWGLDVVWNALLAPFILKEKLTRWQKCAKMHQNVQISRSSSLCSISPFLKLPGSCFGSWCRDAKFVEVECRHRLVGSILVMTGSIGSACFGNQEDEMTKSVENEVRSEPRIWRRVKIKMLLTGWAPVVEIKLK